MHLQEQNKGITNKNGSSKHDFVQQNYVLKKKAIQPMNKQVFLCTKLAIIIDRCKGRVWLWPRLYQFSFVISWKDIYPSSFQTLVVDKVLGNYVLKGCVPEYLSDPGKLKQNQTIVNNFKCGLSNHLSGQKNTPIVIAKNIVCIIENFNKS
jgi:hypothetical protein